MTTKIPSAVLRAVEACRALPPGKLISMAELAESINLALRTFRDHAANEALTPYRVRQTSSVFFGNAETAGGQGQKEHLTFEESGDSGMASSLRRDIRTLDDLLRFANVDRTVWEVEKYIVNRWEMVMRGADDKAQHEPLYQIKAWLKRKGPQLVAIESLLKSIEGKAPLLKLPKFPKQKTAHRRSLEVCVMDPHIGLLCQRPEADAPWDMDIAAATIFQAIDDLIEKAKFFGPFEEAFMPFGNDFVHTDNVFHTTTAGTGQPEGIAWHNVYDKAERIAIEMVNRLRQVARKVYVYEVPGNHSRMADFTLARLLRAYFHRDKGVVVDASSSPYKFHRYGCSLIGYEHGHSVKPIRLAALMANERRKDWSETEYREFHLGDQHRKGSSKPSMLEEQGVSVEYIPGLTAPNEWHRLKSFNHQQRGAMAFVWDYHTGPIGRFQFNVGKCQ